MTETEDFEFIRCPLSGYKGIEAKPGKTACPERGGAFEVDDRGECVFVDPVNLRLPIEGIVCTRCSLVQGEESEKCAYCGGG